MSFLENTKRVVKAPYLLAKGILARARLPLLVKPLSDVWGFDRGLPLHRHYLEQFLKEFAADIQGMCLEFQEDNYTTRFGGQAIERLDILHLDDSNPQATIVAELGRPNDIPDNSFDCIICTHVLNAVFELEKFIADVHRILRPGGVLLVAVPHVSMYDPDAGEIWRFTPGGVGALLRRSFEADQITVRSYGNSLTAAGEIRGLVYDEFSAGQRNLHDPRFAVEVCARAVKS